MRSLLALPLLLVLASCGTAGARTARTAAEPLPLVMGGTAPVSVRPNLIGPSPLDGVYTCERDTRCPGVSDTLPSLSVAVCWRGKALEYLVREVAAKRVTPGPAFVACDWAYSEPVSWAACVETQIRNATPDGKAEYERRVAFARGGLAVWNTTRILKHHNHRPTPNAPPVSVGFQVRF